MANKKELGKEQKVEDIQTEEALKETPSEEAIPAEYNSEEEKVSDTPNYDAWKKGMEGKYGEGLSDEEYYAKSKEGYDAEHAFGNKMREENARFAEAVSEHSDLAAFWKEIAERGKDGHPELALKHISSLLKDYINEDIDEEEYIKAKEEEKQKAEEDKKLIEAQDKAYSDWIAEKGYDVDEWIGKANEMLFSKMANKQMTAKEFDAIDKMLNYDADVKDASEAGAAKARNERIATKRMAEKGGDGLAHPASAPAQAATQKKDDFGFGAIAARRAATRPKF